MIRSDGQGDAGTDGNQQEKYGQADEIAQLFVEREIGVDQENQVSASLHKHEKGWRRRKYDGHEGIKGTKL